MNSRISAIDTMKLKQLSAKAETSADQQIESIDATVSTIKSSNSLYTNKAIIRVIACVLLLFAVVIAAYYMKDHVPNMVNQLYRDGSLWVNYDFYYSSSLTMIQIFTWGLCIILGRRIYCRIASVFIERRILGAGKLKKDILRSKEKIHDRYTEMCDGKVYPFVSVDSPLPKINILNKYAMATDDGENHTNSNNNSAVRAILGAIIGIVFSLFIGKYFLTGLLSVLHHGLEDFAIVQYLYLLVYNSIISIYILDMGESSAKFRSVDLRSKKLPGLLKLLVGVVILATVVFYGLMQYEVTFATLCAQGTQFAKDISIVFVAANILSLGIAPMLRLLRKIIRHSLIIAFIVLILYGSPIFLPQFLLFFWVL